MTIEQMRERGITQRPGRPQTPVTRRQLEALRLAADGRTNAAIASRLGITKDTVAELLGKACRKLGARDRTHAVVLALRLGLLSLDDVTAPEAADAPQARSDPAA